MIFKKSLLKNKLKLYKKLKLYIILRVISSIYWILECTILFKGVIFFKFGLTLNSIWIFFKLGN